MNKQDFDQRKISWVNEVFAIVNEGKNPVSNREISRLGHKNMNRQEMLTHLTEHYQWTPVLYFHKKRRGHETYRDPSVLL